MEIKDIISQLTLREKAELVVDAASLRSKAIPEKNIPKLTMTDGTNGLRIFNTPDSDPTDIPLKNAVNSSFDSPEALAITEEATCFPAGSSLACSWNRELAYEIATAVTEECKRMNVGLLYGPGLNTRRSPLDGRGFEYYSEDPILAGEMAAAYVKGLQDNGIAACVKHFACNNSNYMRTIYDNVIEIRALREIFLAAFERVITKAKPASVMASYNLINGVQSCENEWLLKKILREDWGFEGAVFSDCGAVKDPIKSYNAGIDWQMGFSINSVEKVIEAVKNGALDEKVLNEHCERILSVVLKYSREGKPKPQVDFDAHHELARKAAADCAVLLKNDNGTLPLKKGVSLAVIGSWAEKPVFQGTGCAIVKAKKIDSPLEEIKKNTDNLVYAKGYTNPKQIDEDLINEAVKAAEKSDFAVIFAGAVLPPETDNYNRTDLSVEKAQLELINRVSRVNPNTVVVLMNCESVVMPWIDNVPAVLDMWYSGQGCGDAVAKLLFGDKNPGGKLAVTMPKKLSDCPDYLHFPGENHRTLYGEGIYVGYRYYDKKELEPLFPFGHGLSYTTFEYSGIKLSSEQIKLPETLKVSLTVTNTGAVKGTEVVQLYVSDGHSRIPRPVRELKDFAKITLAPGESREVSFELDKRCFAYFDPAFDTWVTDSGIFTLSFGSSSADIRLETKVFVRSDRKYYLPITEDGHYMEIFDTNPYAKKVFFDSLVEWGLCDREDVTDEFMQKFYNSFWGMKQHLDLVVPFKVNDEMIKELVARMNAAAKQEEKE